jgi:hypothetical protein
VLGGQYDRKNDLGQATFNYILWQSGLDQQTTDECWEERTASRNRYRREITYYAEALKALGISLYSITTLQAAEDSLARAVRWLDENTIHSDVLQYVKSSVSVMYAYCPGWPSMTQSTRLRATLKSIRRRMPTVRQQLAPNCGMAVLWLCLCRPLSST